MMMKKMTIWLRLSMLIVMRMYNRAKSIDSATKIPSLAGIIFASVDFYEFLEPGWKRADCYIVFDDDLSTDTL